MTKNQLDAAMGAVKETYKNNLQILWDSINKGQQKQLYKISEIKALLDRYGVKVK